MCQWDDSGWICSDDDGCSRMNVRIDTHMHSSANGSEPIEFEGGDGFSYSLSPSDVPEWQTLVDVYEECDDDLYEVSRENLRTYRTELVEMFDEVLYLLPDVEIEEPSSGEIYASLREIDELEDIPIRAGDYEGAGYVLAWIDRNGDYQHTYAVTENDVERVIKDCKPWMIDAVMSRLTKEDY